ncbi:MAG: penicillin-binding protein 2 [Patescibacteria group bacterium]
MKNGPLSRIWFLNTGVLVISLFMVGQLGYIQIVQGEMYRDKAERQYTSGKTTSFDRGTIFFSEKTGRKISAATMVPDYTLAVDPTQVTDSQKLADSLADITGVDVAVILAKINRKGDRYEEIAQHLSEEAVVSIKALEEKGVILNKEKKRFYPGGKTAAQVLGFVGWNEDILSGRYGLERYYDEALVRSGNNSSSYFFADLFLQKGKSILSDRERAGDLVTTIEPSVQGFLERTLFDEVRERYGAASASGIIMNPKTGEIYAMATDPSFDPNLFSKEKNQGVFVNPLVEGTYEMGSIIKALTMAAGLDAGVVTAATTYDDKGTRTINTKVIGNFDGKARGVVPMQEVLNQSLNLGTVFVGERLGHERFRDYFKAFGLGEETGIDLPNEGVGRLDNISTTRDIEYATASFGQGVSMTPIATIRALAALANGGVLVTPHVVKRTEYGLGPSRNFVPGGERRVIKKETSVEISRMLTEVVDTALLDGTLKMEHYGIAAKTGTAQQVGSNGKYSESDFLHTFFGYFPSKDPQFIVFLSAKNPRGERYASHTLSKPFMQITKFLINYYEVPPDR